MKIEEKAHWLKFEKINLTITVNVYCQKQKEMSNLCFKI